MPDDELLRTAANRDSLVPVAQQALAAEVEKRGMPALPAVKIEREPGHWWWPMISDQPSARNAAMTGATCSFIVAAFTGALALVSIFKPLSFIKPFAMVDAGAIAILGLMIRKKLSRIAAVAALTIFVAERGYIGIQYGFGKAVGVVTIILLLGFIAGVRGTFAYQKYRKGLEPGTPEASPSE